MYYVYTAGLNKIFLQARTDFPVPNYVTSDMTGHQKFFLKKNQIVKSVLVNIKTIWGYCTFLNIKLR